MNFKSLREQFNEKFPDYSVEVVPPCISLTREMEYIYRAYAVALGKSTERHVTIDHEKKTVTFHRQECDEMKKSLDKMSKRERKEYFSQFRNSWTVNPVTRKENKNKWKEKRQREMVKEKCD